MTDKEMLLLSLENQMLIIQALAAILTCVDGTMPELELCINRHRRLVKIMDNHLAEQPIERGGLPWQKS
jgi:hypothetical protein